MDAEDRLVDLAERLINAGYEDTIIFEDVSYAGAFIGVSEDGRAIYDFNKMVEWLMEMEDFEDELEAVEWLFYNTIGALPSIGEKAPIIMYTLEN